VVLGVVVMVVVMLLVEVVVVVVEVVISVDVEVVLVGAVVVEATTKTDPNTPVAISLNGYAPRPWNVYANGGTVVAVMLPELNRGRPPPIEGPLLFCETITWSS
jgi:Mn2+/Fe2+ NRAMP family transporter